MFWHCDRIVDCDDGSDEDTESCRNTTSCTEAYMCKNLHCISKIWRCDGKDDCGDGSDETHCDINLIEPDNCSIGDRKFLCHDHKKCIDIENVCNNKTDCLDSSDEGGICNNETALIRGCKAMNCSSVFECLEKPHGIMCVCPKGTHSVNNTCLDIDECEEYGICDQFCHNIYNKYRGQYECSCHEDYELVDNHKCKIKGDNPVLVYSSLQQIKVFDLVTHSRYTLVDKLQQATGLAVDGSNIYWTIIYEGLQAIVRANKNNTKPEVIVTSGLGTPENLAIDSITHNLYFTDGKMKHIGVCNNDGSICTVLHNKNIDKPRAIAVSPIDGFMYWTDWGKIPMIAKSGMDGSLPQMFVTNDIHWPNGIHVDYIGKRIYWVDAKLQVIESIKLDKSDRRVVITESVDHPFSVTVFENKLYWSDWSGKEIKVCDKFTGKDRKSLVHETHSRVYGMQIFHPSLFKSQTPNLCETAKCSDMCLLAPKTNVSSKGYSCACPVDKFLSSDGLMCYDIFIPSSLIVSTSTSILEIQQKYLGRQKVKEIPMKNKLSRISAVAYNSIFGNVIIYDSKSKKLWQYDLVKTKLSDFIPKIDSLHSLKFDNHGNNLYWCDLTRKTLDVLSLTTYMRTTILYELDGHIPISVALVPDRGFMFVAMKDGSRIHIDKFDMDGNIMSLVHVVEYGIIADEIVLHFDLITRRLYFNDIKNDLIDSVDEDGLNRKIIKNSGLVKDIVSMDNELFWITQGSTTLNWIDTKNDDRSSSVLDIGNWNSDSNLQLTVVYGIDRNIQHPCKQENGGCSHICLLSGKNKVCRCPSGLILSKNGLECTPFNQCKSDEYRCSTGECIHSRFRCDSKQDCLNGDDEDPIKCLSFMPDLCPKSQFLCHDKTKCIDKKMQCNNVNDCSDGSDEKNCGSKHTCDPITEFFCQTGECIQRSFLCDSNLDCMNGEDELHCHDQTCHQMEFRCKSGNCIASVWECDGEIDCIDGSDEHSNCAVKKCKTNQFACSNGRCVDHNFTCNGEDDCDDNSDEKGCPSSHAFLKKPLVKLCNSETEFECENVHGHCVPIEARCNSTSECKLFEDELNCGCQKPDFFECDNKLCVPKVWLCDETDDCGDQSDENTKTCSIFFQHSTVSTNECDGYLCKNKECIPSNKVCDNKIDCKDGTDEGNLCGKFCQFMNCSHTCEETPNGGKCTCYHGYTISIDGLSCKDVDECQDNNICAQYCTNLDGSYSCHCFSSDYLLRPDKSSCKALGPIMNLVYSDAGKIKSISGDFKESTLLFSNSGFHVTDLDIDTRRNLIYWTSEEADTLICMDMHQEHKVYMQDLINPTKVRIDWLTENVYFVENYRDIVVCNLNSKKCATIYNANIHTKIKAFTIDPLAGLMFWAESIWAIWDSPTTVIRQSDCSGYNVKTIIDQEVHDITDLTIDPIKHLVYWVDQANSAIERANYDGSKRNIIIYTNHLPKKISLFEDKLFWTNDATEYPIFKCKVFTTTGAQCEPVSVQVFAPIEIFSVVQQAKQINASNVCSHVHCDFICTSGSKGPMCVCEDGSQVEPGTECDDAGHRKLPTFKNINDNSNTISYYIALFIIIVTGLSMFYYYLYHYKKKLFIMPGFHFHNPLSTVTEVMSRGDIIQHEHLEPGQHTYENPMNEEMTAINVVSCEEPLSCNGTRGIYVTRTESGHTQETEYEDYKKKLIVL
ncbi:Hypothetical protein CINCED_3A006126 [Cinara cedri]|nr:Hypothetical protein CINCED_3A006126 [Cinara cedri]